MEFIDLYQEIQRLADAGQNEQAGILKAYLEFWPNARAFRHPIWGDLRICCRDANVEVNQLELGHQAAVHDHLPMEVWPFVAIGPHERLHSDPPCFIVADAPVKGFGEIPREGWRDDMDEEDINRHIIQKVGNYLERHPPVLYDDED
jgi:hypothetical protein